MSQKRRPVMLAILDGWGWREDAADNAVRLARTPTFDRLWSTCPKALLITSGLDVGLPRGQMGNSEVGHLNIGAGRVVMQDLPRIGQAIETGEIAQRAGARRSDRQAEEDRWHVSSDGARFAGWRAFASGSCRGAGQDPDGGGRAGRRARVDRWPRYAATFGRGVCEETQRGAAARRVKIATVCGRYYAMDRDKRWERVAKAYDAMMLGKGAAFADAQAVIADAHAKDVTDEFILPAVIGGYARHEGRRRCLVVQFPRRPCPRNPGGAARSEIYRPRASAGRKDVRGRRHDRIRRRVESPAQRTFSRARTSTTCWARPWPMPAARKCAWRNPRSTRTSLISSMAARRRRMRARTAFSCRRRKSRPMICSRRCRRPN